jgi:xylulose-5-phosphate/fructose-6-phosphate phosphoketolase
MTSSVFSHINAETPGCIHEGGELGYALSVSFGAVMDNPDLIVACVVGDGEAETGPTATYVFAACCRIYLMIIILF